MTRRLHRIAAASSIVLLATCDSFLPLPRERAAAPAQQPAMAEYSRPKKNKPAPWPRAEVPAAEAGPAFEQIRRSLRRLVVAEQGFFAENGVYTQDLSKLAFREEGESEIRFVWLGREGWAVSGTHPKLPGRDCVVFVGPIKPLPTSQRYHRSGRPGVPACDLPPRPGATDDTSGPRPADTASALDAVSPSVQMKVDLRKLVQAQDAYHGTMGVYSPRVEALPLQFAWQRKVKVFILDADERSWSARATHSFQPGKSCVIWFGLATQRPATDGQRRLPQRAGIPACDD